jgi:hypothetical protein
MGKSLDRGDGLAAPPENINIGEVGGVGTRASGVFMVGSVVKETIGVCEVDAEVLGLFAT